jgi:hypothetical protein
MLRVAPQNQGAAPADGYGAPANYPGIAVPVTQPAPANPGYYQPRSPQQYPAQVPTTAMYQPMRQPAPQRYAPAPQQYAPAPQQNVPQPQQYAPAPQQYAPAPQQNVPQPQQYVPAPQQYVPAPQQYVPAPPQYVPQPQPYRYAGPYARPMMQTAQAQPPAPQPIPVPPAAPAMQPAAEFPPAPSEMPPQGQGVTSQMLAEPGCYGGNAYYGGNEGCGTYRGAVGRFEQAACGPACGDCGDEGCGGCCPWYASVMALTLNRSDGRRLWTSYATGTETNQMTNTQEIGLAWKWGGEVRFGRRFCWNGSTWAVEATYWTTEALTGYRSTTNPLSPFTVSTPLRVGELWFGDSSHSATGWFNGAAEHRLWRRDEFQNVEVNLMRLQMAYSYDSPWDIGWSMGVRYFRFEENLQFGALAGGHSWGQGGGYYEAYLNDTVTNSLLGFQFGFDAAYSVVDGCRLFVTPKMGIYDNHINQNFQAYLGNGVVGTGPYGSFPVVASRDALAFLMQIDVGVDWQLSRNWSARVGYRVVALTGVALAEDQFPQYIVDLPEIAHIDSHSSLLLHGAFAGLTYNF